MFENIAKTLFWYNLNLELTDTINHKTNENYTTSLNITSDEIEITTEHPKVIEDRSSFKGVMKDNEKDTILMIEAVAFKNHQVLLKVNNSITTTN